MRLSEFAPRGAKPPCQTTRLHHFCPSHTGLLTSTRMVRNLRCLYHSCEVASFIGRRRTGLHPYLSYSIAHELARMVYQFRRDGCLETVGPAGTYSSSLVPGSAHITLSPRFEWPIPNVSHTSLPAKMGTQTDVTIPGFKAWWTS